MKDEGGCSALDPGPTNYSPAWILAGTSDITVTDPLIKRLTGRMLKVQSHQMEGNPLNALQVSRL